MVKSQIISKNLLQKVMILKTIVHYKKILVVKVHQSLHQVKVQRRRVENEEKRGKQNVNANQTHMLFGFFHVT